MSKQQLLQDLIGAKALIDTPEKWIQGELASTAGGIKTGVCAKDAACFCSLGALINYLYKEDNEEERDTAIGDALDAAAVRLTGDAESNIVRFNDSHTYAEVMAVWDSAIAAAEKAAQIENLEILREAVMAQPENLFDLSKYKQDTVCGTLFCTIGLASTLPHFQALGVTLVSEPRGADHKPFLVAKIKGENAYESDETDTMFGPHAFNNLFNPSEAGDLDDDLGYYNEYVNNGYGGLEYVANMTDKELAIARLTHQIALLKNEELI